MFMLGIYFYFSFSGVLSSLLKVAQSSIERPRPNFNSFCLEIGKNFKHNIFFGRKRL